MDQAQKICERLELGEPLSSICKDKDMPDVSTVYKKCRADEKLKDQIMAARQMGVWTLLDKIAEDMQIPKSKVKFLLQAKHVYRILKIDKIQSISILAKKVCLS